MPRRSSPLSPDVWLQDLFASKSVQDGSVIRRKARDVERFVGMDRFLDEIDRRGFQVIENSGQLVIFCNRDPVFPLRIAHDPGRRSLSKTAFRNL